MGKSDPNNTNPHRQQSIVIIPSDTPGVKIGRKMMVFGWDDAPEGEFDLVVVVFRGKVCDG
jgi:acyl-CoA dehydrogenase